MTRLQILGSAVLLVAAVSGQRATAAESSNAGFAKLRSLAGEWEGSAEFGGKPMPATTSFRLVSDGSVILDDLGPGTPHEMVTMFHLDGNDLLATHYCSHHNQPRMRAIPSQDPNVLQFDFKDATNLASAAAPHMTRVKFIILDGNHHVEEWTATTNGQASTVRFDFHRKR